MSIFTNILNILTNLFKPSQAKTDMEPTEKNESIPTPATEEKTERDDAEQLDTEQLKIEQNETEQAETEQVVTEQVDAQSVDVLRIRFECQIDKPIDSDKEARTLCRELVKLDLPNAKAGEEYCYVRNFENESALRWRLRFTDVHSEGFDRLGLGVSKDDLGGEFRIEGVPTRAFEGAVKIAAAISYETIYTADGLKFRGKSTLECEREGQFIVNPNPWDIWEKHEPQEDLPYRKSHNVSVSCVLPTKPQLTLLAASERGRSHAHEGKFRDDHLLVDEAKTPDDWTIVAVADGAGSAKYSRKGSELACENAVKTLRQVLEQKVENSEDLLFDVHLRKEWESRRAEAESPKSVQQAPEVPLEENVATETTNSDASLFQEPEPSTNSTDAGSIIDSETLNEAPSDDERLIEETGSVQQDLVSSEVANSENKEEAAEKLNDVSDCATPAATTNASETPQTSEQEHKSDASDLLDASSDENPLVRTQASKALYAAVYNAWFAIQEETKRAEEPTTSNDFNTTLLLAAIKRLPKTDVAPAVWVVLTYWVGDGAMAVYRPDGKDEVMTLGLPDGGEFAGQTRFLTTRGEVNPQKVAARSRLVFLQDFDKIALMTDGVSDPFFPAERDFKSYARWQEFWKNDMPEHFPGVMDTSATIKEREEKLLEGLTFKIAGNHDDRTLLLILNENGEQEDEGGVEG